ncbi:hypothetical protein [Luteimicrobium sp. DT211]|uniref:hypothetical protein n=1 Tax=Luteimicrobium sp. DT211 TaxID=3393412 RepID=UPI003CF0C868
MTTARAPGTFRVAHLVFSTVSNVTTQGGQVACFRNAAGERYVPFGSVRYTWPAELDLMARLAGFGLRDRWAGFDRSELTATSPVARVGLGEAAGLRRAGRPEDDEGPGP